MSLPPLKKKWWLTDPPQKKHDKRPETILPQNRGAKVYPLCCKTSRSLASRSWLELNGHSITMMGLYIVSTQNHGDSWKDYPPKNLQILRYIDHLSFIVIFHVETTICTMWKLISGVFNWKKCGKVKPFQSSEKYLVFKKKFGGKWTQNWRNFIRGTFIHPKTYVSFRVCFFSARLFLMNEDRKFCQ